MDRKQLKKLFIHRRSISQLMEAMTEADDSVNNSEGIDNPSMSEEFRDQPNDDNSMFDQLGSGCLNMIDPLSPDSEYDEGLAFPDSMTIISMGGDNPVVVQRQKTGNETSSDSEDSVDATSPQVRSFNELPYIYIYNPPVKFSSFQRKIFIPGVQINVEITDYERTLTSHLLNPNLYTIQLTHGSFVWSIKKRYKDFSNLHQQLRIFRTSLNFPFPTRTHREIRSSFRNNHKISASNLSNSTNANTDPQKVVNRRKKKKGSLPRFPKRPDALIPVELIPTRIKQLEKYLENLLNISLYRTHHDLIDFLEVSHLSFISALGEKGKETMMKKRTGSTYPGQKKCNLFGCFGCGCCIRCNYFCSDIICGQWQQRWFFVKDTYFGLIRPKDGVVRSITLFDQGFEVSTGMYNTGLRNGLQIYTNSRYVVLKCGTRKAAKEWTTYLKTIANTHSRDFTSPNPHNSYAPVRTGALAGWFVDGASFMSAVADGLEGATEEIFIADWWLSPEIYMKRPTMDGDYWRLDKILLRKAIQGVKIFVLLYKELEMAMGINSYYSKQKLVELHENIKVLRHPDHARVGILFWAHHEKLVCIDQTYAFVGGIDLCYGRWDDHTHRLTDLGSISTMKTSTMRKSFTVIENPIRSLIFQSKGILQATATPNINRDPKNETINLSVIKAPNKSILKSPITSPSAHKRINPTKEKPDEVIEENTKRNTPEMERKNVLEKIKENVKTKGRDLINRITLHSDESDTENVENKEVKVVVEEAPEDSPTIELDGQAKFWIGKDYTNFILKDFAELNLPYADLVDRTKTPRMPWHDVHSVVVGQPARDVARHFIERWNSVKLEKARENFINFPYLIPKSYSDMRVDSNFWNKNKVKLYRVTCQVLRSASQWSCGFIEADTEEQSIHEAYVESITKAQHYVYIENQFFISMGFPDPVVKNQIAETIYKRIVRAYKEKKVFRVYVVLPLLPGFEGDVSGVSGNALRVITHWNYASICRAENSIIKRLLKAGIKNPKDYITFHSLRTHSTLNGFPVTELIYVHSKLMIIDDKTVIVGSANINDRSMIGKRDSEVDVIITDESFDDGKMNGQTFPCGHYAGQLRKYLFREHLGLLDAGDGVIDMTDPTIESFYKDVWQKISLDNSNAFDKIFRCIPNDNATTIANCKKYCDEPALVRTDPKAAEIKLKEIQGHLVDLPLEFLVNEILTPPSTSKEGMMPTVLWT